MLVACLVDMMGIALVRGCYAMALRYDGTVEGSKYSKRYDGSNVCKGMIMSAVVWLR